MLGAVEKARDPTFAERVFEQIVREIYSQLAEVQIVYPVPLRISLDTTIELMKRFLAEQSGGDRVQAVACALFSIIGRRFGLFDTVRREAINASDVATGLAADLECVDNNDKVVLAVEVKDKELTIAHLESKLQNARAKAVAELLFIAQKGIAPADEAQLYGRIDEAFAQGQNVYIFDLVSLARVALALLGEQARPEFLRLVGQQLDEFRSDLRHRRAWRDLLVS